MSGFAAAASSDLERRLESTLSRGERWRMGWDLGSTMLAMGLLLVAFLFEGVRDASQYPLIELFKAAAALIVSGPILFQAMRGVWTGDPEDAMEQLVALAVLAALVSGEFTTAATIPLILNVGHFLERRSMLGTQEAIQGLSRLQSRHATLLTAEGERQADPKTLKPDDRIVVRPGDLLPVDGIVRHGTSTVDQSSISGESVPEEVGVGATLFAGSTNLTGCLEVEVVKVGSSTALGRVLELLRSAEQSKTPAVRLVERFAGYWVPAMLVFAAVLFFVTRDMSRVVALMVVACPGAFILAGPTAMIAALAAASRQGILVKNTKFIEVLAQVDSVVLDKTGTLTLGQLEVVETIPCGQATCDELIRVATFCAMGSRHPVSLAIGRHPSQSGATLLERPLTMEEVPGRGVVAKSEQQTCLLGRGDWLSEHGLSLPVHSMDNRTAVWVARDGVVLGQLLLTDLPRPEACQALDELRQLGMDRLVLLTGDRREPAERVARSLNIDRVIAEVLPEQKLEVVQAEKAAGFRVMVVGDGVNDALALACGDVGIAMGAMGSDIALESADVALMKNDLTQLPLAIRLSRRTHATISQNLLVGVGSSLMMLALAASGFVSPLAAAVLHNGGEIFVILNSARLLGFRKDQV